MKSIASALLAAVLVGLSLAQPPRSEEEDTKAKKPAAPIDIDSFPDPKAKAKSKDKKAPSEGPGVAPGRGTLVVGVRQLPVQISPSRATSDAEKWALDLLFESLVQPVGSEAGTVFDPQLSIGPPRVDAGSRTFELDPQARWHDGKPVIANDVIATLARGRRPELGDASSDSPRRIRLHFKAPHPDPASLCNFYITPAHHQDNDAFAKSPVGSGPFRWDGITTEGGRKYATFTANGDTSKRHGQANLPRIATVRMLEGADPVADFRRGLCDVAVTERTVPATSEVVARLETGLGPEARVVTRPSRRIMFLAMNPLKAALGGDAGRALRRAIAFGIDREAILNSQLRGGGQKHHSALTGPFPAGTWCCDPDAPPLDDATLAVAELKANVAGRLPLIYSNADASAGPICEMIRDQLQNIVGIDVTGLEPAAYQRALTERSFALAYQSFDYRDDWFDPQSLFAMTLPGFGQGGARLEAALARSGTHSEFVRLRESRHRLHREFREAMPFVPLWCLDYHVVLRRNITTSPIPERIDPLAPLRQLAEWKIDRQ